MTEKEAYDKGFQDGLRAFAWWKNGEQFVGSCDTTLKEAVAGMEDLYGYAPPVPEPAPKPDCPFCKGPGYLRVGGTNKVLPCPVCSNDSPVPRRIAVTAGLMLGAPEEARYAMARQMVAEYDARRGE